MKKSLKIIIVVILIAIIIFFLATHFNIGADKLITGSVIDVPK